MKNKDVTKPAAADLEQIIRERVGKTIHNRRLNLGISQEVLAEKADCHRNTIGIIERGEKSVSIYNLHMIALGLQATAAEILEEADV